jgi:uncharacterized membrane protein YeaQ/YmgE (transglycosylase-associated protein family)
MASALRALEGDQTSPVGRTRSVFVRIIRSFGWTYSRLEKIMELSPGGIIAWLLVGLVAGWLAGQFMRGGGFGLVGDIVMGIVGAFVGGLVFSFLMPGSSVGLLGSIVVAFIGAVVLIALIRVLPGRSPI